MVILQKMMLKILKTFSCGLISFRIFIFIFFLLVNVNVT